VNASAETPSESALPRRAVEGLESSRAIDDAALRDVETGGRNGGMKLSTKWTDDASTPEADPMVESSAKTASSLIRSTPAHRSNLT
jgi:hypothetical protein